MCNAMLLVIVHIPHYNNDLSCKSYGTLPYKIIQFNKSVLCTKNDRSSILDIE